MVDFEKVFFKFRTGYLAVIDRSSPAPEKAAAAGFSNATKHVLGIGGWYQTYPLIKPYSWDDNPMAPGPHRMHVFVMVFRGQMVGYLAVRWHYLIKQHGCTLDARGRPIEEAAENAPAGRAAAAVITAAPQLQAWGVDGICVLPEYQRRGLGSLLITKSLAYLGTNIFAAAFCPPFTDASRALLRRLGLDTRDARLCPGA